MQLDKYLAYIDSLARTVDPGREPGFCSAVLQNGEIIHRLNHGLSSLEHAVPLAGDSLFYLASVSKQFTAACILKLVHDKHLRLSQDVRAIVKEAEHFPEKITVQNLLNHTSGIPDYFAYLNCQRGRRHSDYFDNSDILNIISHFEDFCFSPNERMNYSNSNYILLAQVVKNCSGLSLARFARKHIFGPLGMKQTRYDDDRFKVVANRVSCYEKSPGSSRTYRAELMNCVTVGDGGVLSSINDLIKWELNFHDNRYLDTAVIRGLTRTRKLANGQRNEYANGLELSTQRDKESFSYHGGSFAGFTAFLARIPSQRLSLIYLSNNGSLDYNVSLHGRA